jgi:hypothetical protein
MKTHVFWHVPLVSLDEYFSTFRKDSRILLGLFGPEAERTTISRNVGNYHSNGSASHPRRLQT